MELIDPYRYVRLVTITLGGIWTLAALLRLVRFGRRWENRLHAIGIQRSWFRRRLVHLALRATILDPVNATLFALLMGLWTLGAFVRI